jgi:hypothetical protein
MNRGNAQRLLGQKRRLPHKSTLKPQKSSRFNARNRAPTSNRGFAYDIDLERPLIPLFELLHQEIFCVMCILITISKKCCHRERCCAAIRASLNAPAEFEVHLILDNYGTHKTATIQRWLLKRPRFKLHFTPTSASWINLVERWFGLLTVQQLRRASFAARAVWKQPFVTTSTFTMKTQSHSFGPKLLMTSWIVSPDFVSEL